LKIKTKTLDTEGREETEEFEGRSTPKSTPREEEKSHEN
jgi:hypothetical protein